MSSESSEEKGSLLLLLFEEISIRSLVMWHGVLWKESRHLRLGRLSEHNDDSQSAKGKQISYNVIKYKSFILLLRASRAGNDEICYDSLFFNFNDDISNVGEKR